MLLKLYIYYNFVYIVYVYLWKNERHNKIKKVVILTARNLSFSTVRIQIYIGNFDHFNNDRI